MKHFALSSVSTTYTPPSLEGRGISFILRCPNEDEMEKLSTELFRRGCVPVEQDRMRAVLIDELYNLYDEAKADEAAGLLEQCWNGETAYNNAVGLWMEQERERLRDVANGAPDYPMAKHPEPMVGIRVQSRAKLIRDEVMEKSDRFKALTIQAVNYESVQKEWTMRLYVLGWTGLKTPIEKEPDGNALTEDCFDKMVEEIGKLPARELYYEVSGSFSIDREEVGNSASPANGDTDPKPSPAPSTESESSAGASTTSNIEPTPQGGLDLESSASSISG